MTIDAKALREQLEALTAKDDPTARKNNDTLILRDEYYSHMWKDRWENMSDEERGRRLDRTYTEESRKGFKKFFTEKNPSKDPEKVAQRKQTKLANGSEKPPEYWQEIYDLFWGEDRNSKKLKDKVCKQYGVKPGTLHTLINGGVEMNLPQETKDTHAERLLDWRKRYGDMAYIHCVVSPEGDLMEYDTLNEAGQWMCKELGIERDNPGNYIWPFFKKGLCKRGIWKDWEFKKEKRYE